MSQDARDAIDEAIIETDDEPVKSTAAVPSTVIPAHDDDLSFEVIKNHPYVKDLLNENIKRRQQLKEIKSGDEDTRKALAALEERVNQAERQAVQANILLEFGISADDAVFVQDTDIEAMRRKAEAFAKRVSVMVDNTSTGNPAGTGDVRSSLRERLHNIHKPAATTEADIFRPDVNQRIGGGPVIKP